MTDGLADGSDTWFSTTADWSGWLNVRVVCAPTLNVRHVSNACSAVWLTVTTVRPLAEPWVGALVPNCCASVGFGISCRPPAVRPSGTNRVGWENAIAAAADCAADARASRAVRFAMLAVDCAD